MAKSSHNHGFTLIELLIALAVMVAIATVAAPQFSRAMIYVELRKSTQEFAASLRNARNRSITEARTSEVIFDAEHQFLRVKEQGIIYKKSIILWREYKAGKITGEEFNRAIREIKEEAGLEVEPFDENYPFGGKP